MEKEFIFSIDLGGTSSKVAILKTDGKILEKWEIPTNKAENGKFIVEEIYYSFNKKINELNIKPDQFFGIGMGAPGPVLKDGRITRAVNIGWENYPLKAELEKTFSLPAYVENDANCAALGELWLGAGKGLKDIVAITLGTGVGGGVIIDGHIVGGTTGGGGEIGHMTVQLEHGFRAATDLHIFHPRRIRDRTLRMEYMQVGRRSKTDVVVCYLEDIADEELVIDIKKSLEKIDTDGIPMAEKTVEEFISGNHWNPYPTVRYTERPDTAAAHLYEGHVCIIVDGSPSVIIAPTTFWHHLQHAEEYRNKPVVGAYLRLVRFLAVWASIFLLPLWYLLAVQPELLLERLSFIGPNEDGQIPLFLQFLLIEVGIDMLRMAAIHTPSSLATALGLVAALMIGQVAVEVGLFSNEVILYLSIAAIGMFATPSYEMSLANRIFRLILLTLTAILHEIGFVIGTFLWVLLLVTMKSYNVPYLWPFIPFDFKGMMDIIIRAPIPLKRTRPKFLDPKDPDR